MNVIDQEILIPASPEFIWRFIGDLSAIPRWHNEVVSVSFLSTQREGRGTRWRESTVKGSDVIVEVSAWYDTLGYEYRLVDGSTYSDNQGRIRLQEVTDGTLVRWTFQYAPGGMLGSLRNAMRLKRSAANRIQDSLRSLHQLIAQESGGISTHEAKANMQDAPDARERSSYQPRHPSAFHELDYGDVAEDTTQSERFPLPYDMELAAPPAVDETDTKPNPVVLGVGDEAISAAEPELDDTRPVAVEALLADIAPLEAANPAPAPEPLPPEQPKAEPRLRDTPRPEPIPREPPKPAPIPPERPEPAPTEEPLPPPASAKPFPSRDSSHLSVFEIFGLQKPSESQANAETADEPPKRAAPANSSGDEWLLAPEEAAHDGALDEIETTRDPEPATYASDGGVISGLRRSARRKKTLIRSHT